MDDLYFSVPLEDDRLLCLAPLTERRLEMAGQDLEDTSGYFLYEQRGEGDRATVEIIAHVVSPEGAMRLRDMFKMS
jgi:hypothetical protein